MLTAFQNGSVWVWLSAFIWGLGNLIRRQFVKGTLFLAAEAGVVLFTIQSGLYNLDKLTTLGGHRGAAKGLERRKKHL